MRLTRGNESIRHHVTIPSGTRYVGQLASMMAEQLSQQTGFHVSCCQAMVSGVPWGMAKVTLEAQDKPAREVLKELMHLEEQANSELSMRHPVFDHWTLGCDGTGAAWCFIEVRGRYTGRCM